MTTNKNRDEVQQYVGDMVALESHIEQAMDGQLKHEVEHAEAAAAIRRFHDMVKMQREALKGHLAKIGGSEPGPIKSAVATLFGVAAGAIDNVRTKAVSKMLRDDYTAFNHAAMGYSMLHVTAHALGEMETMEIADRHLRGYARAVQEINQLIPSVVVWELEKDDMAPNRQAIEHCTEAINRAWQESNDGLGTGSAGKTMRKAA
jgi:ferritin-like metal-binding protein YciE